MASSGANFTAAINALVAERDRVFLLQVAADYNLSYEELHTKYLETAEKAIKVPRQYKKREPKSVTVVTEGEPAKGEKPAKAKAEKQCCTAQTSKKEPCKFSALKGEVFCKRHLRQSLEEKGEVAAKPAPKKAAKKAAEPLHTHTLDAETHEDCASCQSHGNPLNAAEPEDFEEVPQRAKPSAAERLAALLAEGDEEEDDEEEMEITEETYDDEE